MPTISMFFGIIISMYYDDHNPPHFHAKYNDDRAIFDISSGEIIRGEFSTRNTRLVQAWLELNKDALMANWHLAEEKGQLFTIKPL